MSIQSLLPWVFGIWLGALTIGFFLFANFFRRLVKGTEGGELKKVLEGILARQAKNAQGVEELNRQVAILTEEGFGHVQKVGLVRFNPFKEIGGDHSFSLALLDGRGMGIVITGLHTRERTRLYAKVIKSGRSEFQLSEEEVKALAKAQKD
ncbi:MAG: hypothetical protein UX88_C0008G0005 [Candidatus Woesebacteria bacterium GW2011_GWC2_47_16]|uniref:DUF4446 domain-containing protein n=7 Tax=Candidatus Woeseibacteriota TaxID=1752722 RepID=A0A1F8D8G7_9BACT|nr:MAG: hypothetical protein UX03_C0008G0006 [Candidatus Woesebacteria bacterium GW2011_GWE1_45_18]KKU22956.1 MAG: hypothetical protein UX34_C0018G0004 [Candidatus Woesebacteria bacterium GW2011_GWF1_46_13]KKU64847.1 MAG: hypothetical protein UX88_C0008G0005 [Candidatus Woesebacteria bacterium GW2011_GWC2_47_16]OGM79474.1 MAG: hypothetical protein A2197_00670 [Candidatus Woesebacteria bacterium RIFOXYA1_FULL_48_16]OGM84248.1 MAG: hypothetical protein A2376_01360 [Candidatus Woesebacteria bacter